MARSPASPSAKCSLEVRLGGAETLLRCIKIGFRRPHFRDNTGDGSSCDHLAEALLQQRRIPFNEGGKVAFEQVGSMSAYLTFPACVTGAEHAEPGAIALDRHVVDSRAATAPNLTGHLLHLPLPLFPAISETQLPFAVNLQERVQANPPQDCSVSERGPMT